MMNSPQSAFNPDLDTAHENLSDIRLFTNPFMKTALVSYQLSSHANMAMVIVSESGQEMRRVLKPAGMPGGQKGLNKLFWDGTKSDGNKVSVGRYKIVLYENNEVRYASHWFRLGG